MSNKPWPKACSICSRQNFGQVFLDMYSLSKKSWPITNLLYRLGKGFLNCVEKLEILDYRVHITNKSTSIISLFLLYQEQSSPMNIALYSKYNTKYVLNFKYNSLSNSVFLYIFHYVVSSRLTPYFVCFSVIMSVMLDVSSFASNPMDNLCLFPNCPSYF